MFSPLAQNTSCLLCSEDFRSCPRRGYLNSQLDLSSRQVDASADAGAATCHSEDTITMFQPNKQHVEEKGK